MNEQAGEKNEETVSGAGGQPTPINIRKILVPVDFSDCSRKALRYALAFARQFSAQVVLLHVVHVNYTGIEFGLIDFPVLEEEMAKNARKSLEEMAGTEVGGSAPVEVVVRVGQTVREIADAAREAETDLLVISTHGNTGLKHVLLGSTAENVVRYAPCPVLVVREHEHEFVE